MALLFSSWFLDLLAVLVALVTVVYLYATRNFSYWKKKGIPYIKPWPVAGNLVDTLLFRKCVGLEIQELHNRHKGKPFVGIFAFDQPILLVRDLDLAKNILQKDFHHFVDKGFVGSKNDPLFNESLFAKKGQSWKNLRSKLSPAFSSGKMKRMFLLVEEKAALLDTYFDEAVKSGKPADIKDVLAKFTTDVVSSVGFGINSNSLENPNDEFRHFLKNSFIYDSPFSALKLGAMFAGVPLIHILGSTILGSEAIAFLRDAIWSTVQHRKTTESTKNDYLDLLIQLKEKGKMQDDGDEAAFNNENKEKPFTLEGDVFVSQAFVFLAAGFETSAATMSFCMYHLALMPKIQTRLREEIHQVVQQHGGKVTYQAVHEMPYLDMVLSETLRLYPIMPILDRTCVKEYTIPGTDVVIDKNVRIYISLLGIQKDPNIYPDPERFDPERFSEENKQDRHKSAYMPFGDGPRICIGMRFGLMQAKVGLAHILLNYEVEPCAETPIPFEYEIRTFLLASVGGLPLTFKKVAQ